MMNTRLLHRILGLIVGASCRNSDKVPFVLKTLNTLKGTLYKRACLKASQGPIDIKEYILLHSITSYPYYMKEILQDKHKGLL